MIYLYVAIAVAILWACFAIVRFNAANQRLRGQGGTEPTSPSDRLKEPEEPRDFEDPEETDVQAFIDINDKDAQAFIAATVDIVILDVRTPEEWSVGVIQGAILIPVQVIQGREHEVPAGPLLVVCKAGARSAAAADYLASCGRTEIYNLDCGMMGWTGDTVKP